MTIKEQLYNLCLKFINGRLLAVKHTMDEIQESLLSETKSSAGDKHETGRAMLQLEREKAGNQLAQIQKVSQLLAKISTDKISKTISLGSVVYTTKANYYIAISAGELIVENEKFYAIAANTPIAQLLLGNQTGKEIVFRDQKFTITKVV